MCHALFGTVIALLWLGTKPLLIKQQSISCLKIPAANNFAFEMAYTTNIDFVMFSYL